MTDIISIGGRKWWKSLGDEGQVDLYCHVY